MTVRFFKIFDNAVTRLCEEDKMSVSGFRSNIRAEKFDRLRKYVADEAEQYYAELWCDVVDCAPDIIQNSYNNRIEAIRQQGYEEGLIAGKAEAVLLNDGIAKIIGAINAKDK